MVSLNLYQYRDEVKRALLARKGELEQEWDPFVASWLVYAFACEQDSQLLLLQDLFQRLDAWSEEENVWQSKRNSGPLLFLLWLRRQLRLPVGETYAGKAAQILQTLNSDDRFSPLRSPDQAFLIALGVSAVERVDTKKYLRDIIASQIKGPLARQVMFAAALKELTGSQTPLSLSDPKDITDIITALWWAEREKYSDRSKYWSQFSGSVDTISLHKADEFDTRHILSEWELALLFEALVQETAKPDPNMLFYYYPIHPRIRQIAESDFKQGNYFGAVFEACKVLEDFLKRASGSRSIGARLVSEVLGRPHMNTNNYSPPRVKINDLDQASEDFVSQLDEQKGFSSLATGIFQAFRNPKGHQPKNKDWVRIDPYEALDQLITISLVMKRIEAAMGREP
jgi:uncharacterized protein (TIGR02391 family)